MLVGTMELPVVTGSCRRDGSRAEDEPPRYISTRDERALKVAG